MSAENILKLLEPGTISSASDEDARLEFAGQAWFVKSFVGDRKTAGLLLEATPTQHEISEVIGAFLRSAIVLMTSAAGAEGVEVARPILHAVLDHEIDEAQERYGTIMAERAARTKPS
jgi:hypothetical protein